MSYRLREGGRGALVADLPPALGAELRPLVPHLVEEAVDAVRRRAEAHSQPLEPSHVESVRTVIGVAVHTFLDRVEHASEAEDSESEEAGAGQPDSVARTFRAFGAGEARQGRTLECLHTGLRTSAAAAWRRLARAESVDRDQMAALGEALFSFQEEISAAAAEGHAQVRGAGVEALRRRRARLLEVLLAEAGTEPEARALSTLARSARWRLPERVAVALLLQEGATAAVPVPPPDVLVDLDRLEPCALVPDPEGPGRLRSLERSLRGCCAVLGPTVPLDGAPASLSRARELAELVRTGVVPGSGVLRWGDHLPELLLSRDTALVAEMARTRLAPLEGMRAPQRERMADTLLAWLESGFNANEAAERLRIHPQTVRYRMRQLEELFGPRLREPGARFELELVLRARRLLGPLGPE
ncbi:PucR family transcriptional regulator [Nocardiopsis ganjiahuensis]|uniref:PucR family transcriptional regulator n=1 Tax=Nocardiopsis ganjiahuensis TaxID=239984 RepID=UPI00034BFAD2|nr:helix-turn-helix domain-containing protein [Nocardiopsis ganjiahuensis]